MEDTLNDGNDNASKLSSQIKQEILKKITPFFSDHPRFSDVDHLLRSSLDDNLIVIEPEIFRTLLARLPEGTPPYIGCSSILKLGQPDQALGELSSGLTEQNKLADCRYLLMFTDGGEGLSLNEIIEMNEALSKLTPEGAEIFFGASINSSLAKDEMQVLVLATV